MTEDEDIDASEEVEAVVEALDQVPPLDKSKLIGTSSRPEHSSSAKIQGAALVALAASRTRLHGTFAKRGWRV
jgi:hypothetical protein